MKLFSVVLMCVALSVAGGRASSNETASDTKASPSAALGDKIFHDVSPASGNLACASCHDPARGYAGNDNRAVLLGGANSTQPGFRNAPSLRYLKQNPAFFFDAEDTPTGGFNRDGRAASLAEQARRPNDLPSELRSNVNTSEKRYDRLLGQMPALNAQEIDDLVAFLQTLTDGYQP